MSTGTTQAQGGNCANKYVTLCLPCSATNQYFNLDCNICLVSHFIYFFLVCEMMNLIERVANMQNPQSKANTPTSSDGSNITNAVSSNTSETYNVPASRITQNSPVVYAIKISTSTNPLMVSKVVSLIESSLIEQNETVKFIIMKVNFQKRHQTNILFL